MDKYFIKHDGTPREILFLQTTGCKWGNCEFCDYRHEVVDNPYQLNLPILEQVTGLYKTLDLIVTGSFCELDANTLKKLKEIIVEKNIETLFCDFHYMYRSRVKQTKEFFAPCDVKVRCMVGSFYPMKRLRLKKGLSSAITTAEIASDFQGANLICCINGDTQESILIDITEGLQYFEFLTIRMVHVTTGPLRRDESLAQWFMHALYPTLKKNPRITIEL